MGFIGFMGCKGFRILGFRGSGFNVLGVHGEYWV